MKERSKRWFASIPIIGTVLLLWSVKEDHPDGTADEYAKYKANLLIEP